MSNAPDKVKSRNAGGGGIRGGRVVSVPQHLACPCLMYKTIINVVYIWLFTACKCTKCDKPLHLLVCESL